MCWISFYGFKLVLNSFRLVLHSCSQASHSSDYIPLVSKFVVFMFSFIIIICSSIHRFMLLSVHLAWLYLHYYLLYWLHVFCSYCEMFFILYIIWFNWAQPQFFFRTFGAHGQSFLHSSLVYVLDPIQNSCHCWWKYKMFLTLGVTQYTCPLVKPP
jgi:hypothetical protein